jgi:hypothetical protein
MLLCNTTIKKSGKGQVSQAYPFTQLLKGSFEFELGVNKPVR